MSPVFITVPLVWMCITPLSRVYCMFSIPPCRVYASELVAYFEQHGWTCDDCKACIVCDESPSESEKSEDLLVRIVLVLVLALIASSL